MRRISPYFSFFVAAAVFLLYFFGLGSVGLVGPDEPRYAQVAREMLDTGDYVTPRLGGEPWLEKPPLYYWLAAASFRLLGVNELAARLPCALAGVLFLPLFAWIVGRLYRGETARYAVLVLASSFGWFGYSHGASPEILFTAPLAGALGLFGLWLWLTRPVLVWAAYALLALAVLAKGPTAIVLTGIVLASYSLAVREFRWIRRLLAPGPLLLFFLIALPWYVAVWARHGNTFLEEFIIRHHFRRFMSEELAHPGPWWYYLPVLAGLLFPWTAHLALPIIDAVSAGWRGLLKDPRRAYLAAWIVPIFVFFSLSKGKLPGYLLVVTPPLAIWIGHELANAARSRVRPVALVQAVLLPVVLLLAEALPVALARGLSRAEISLATLDPDLALASVIGGGAVLLAWTAWRERRLATALLATALTAFAVARTITVVAPAVDRLASARPLAERILALGIPLDQLALAPGVRRHVEYGLEFYLNRQFPRSTDARYVVLPDGEIQATPPGP